MHRTFIYYIYHILERLYERFHIFQVIKTPYGLKNINLRYLLPSYEIQDVITLEVNDLYLGPDFLVDDKTLLNVKIAESPHYGMIESILQNKDLAEVDYFKRFEKGILDWRIPRRKIKDYSRYIKATMSNEKKIMEDAYEPVQVCSISGRYYIFDGKHRAAMCAYKRKKVRCIIITNKCMLDGIGKYLFSVIRNDAKYSFHNQLINNLQNK